MRNLIGALVAALLSTGCDSPALPTQRPATLTVNRPVSVQVTGPSRLNPRSVGQYRAVATYADGTTADVTATAVWSASGQLSPAAGRGQMQATARGEGRVLATQDATAGTLPVLILEEGLFKLSGTVRGPDGSGLAARVTVRSGVGDGLAAATDGRGAFTIFGVAGPITLEAVATGFGTAESAIDVHEGATAEIVLTPVTAVTDLRGPWQAELTASPKCTALPEAARRRSYATMMTQQGPLLQANLAAPSIIDLRPGGRDGQFWFNGYFSTPHDLLFEIPEGVDILGDYYPSYFVEMLSPAERLEMSGALSAVFSADEIAATLSGRLRVFNLKTGQASSCNADDHRWVWRRR